MANRPPLDELVALATATATDAGRLLLRGLDHARSSVATKTTDTDMVSAVDRASEELVVTRLLDGRPDDGILGEEGSARSGSTGVRWIVDPLDGTTNYLYGFPAFCVSIAAEIDGLPSVGVVHDPTRSETYTASAGSGAYCNGERIQCSAKTDLATALIGTGFAYASHRREWQGRFLAELLPQVRDVRRAGAAALDLCWVASGRLDGTAERGLMEWDLAAGSVIVAEAGGRIWWPEARPEFRLCCSAAPGIAEALFTLARHCEAKAGPLPD